jgi:hypothetical protein
MAIVSLDLSSTASPERQPGAGGEVVRAVVPVAGDAVDGDQIGLIR